jgi:hypothetical protein
MFKLYQIVQVDRGEYQHLGEVLSFPTPTQTVMVRMVPGHPGTLQEMPLGLLRATQAKCKFVHYAKVSGPGAFPIDMLRRDHAAPVNFDPETGELKLTDGGESRLIATCTGTRVSPWNLERWKSFGWTCEPIQVLPYEVEV